MAQETGVAKKDNTIIVALVIILVVALLGAGAWYWQSSRKPEAPTTPLGTGTTSSGSAPSSPSITLSWDIPSMTSEEDSVILPTGQSEFNFEGVSKDSKYIRYRSVQVSDPVVLIEEYGGRLTQNGWQLGETTDNSAGVEEFGTTFRWWRVKATKGDREVFLTVDLDGNRAHLVEYETNTNAKINYPSDFPDELKSEDDPEWVLLGTDWLGKQMAVVDFTKMPSEFTQEYFTTQGWVGGVVGAAPGIVGNAFGKEGIELYVGSCSKNLPACLNEVRITLRVL